MIILAIFMLLLIGAIMYIIKIAVLAPHSPGLISAILKPKANYDSLITINYSDGTKQEYYGVGTVWYHYPMMKRCSTMTESWLSDIREYIEIHGNPYPTAHLNK